LFLKSIRLLVILIISGQFKVNAQLSGAYNIYYFRFNFDPSYYRDGNYYGVPFEGSPWFSKDFIPARLRLFSGEDMVGGNFKLNLYNGRVFTEDDKQRLIVVTSPIERIEFLQEGKKAAVFQAGFPRIDNQYPNTLYQVLAEGKAQLLKFIRFTMSDRMEYGQGVTFKMDPMFFFYIYSDGQMHKVQKVNDLMRLFPDWANEVKGYIEREDLKIKKETDLIKIVSFYNSLATLKSEVDDNN